MDADYRQLYFLRCLELALLLVDVVHHGKCLPGRPNSRARDRYPLNSARRLLIGSIYPRLHYFIKSIASRLERSPNYVVPRTQTKCFSQLHSEVDHACITLVAGRAAVRGRGSYAFPRRLSFYRADPLRADSGGRCPAFRCGSSSRSAPGGIKMTMHGTKFRPGGGFIEFASDSRWSAPVVAS